MPTTIPIEEKSQAQGVPSMPLRAQLAAAEEQITLRYPRFNATRIDDRWVLNNGD